MNEDKIEQNNKEIFNNLLSRLDTIHDFCDPSASRNKDMTINIIKKKEEFLNIFKPEIIQALDNEIKLSDISDLKIKQNIIPLIDKYISEENSSFYKNDLNNLLYRIKDGLILVNNPIGLRITDKDRYNITKNRIDRFEPSTTVFFEFLYNIISKKIILDYLYPINIYQYLTMLINYIKYIIIILKNTKKLII